MELPKAKAANATKLCERRADVAECAVYRTSQTADTRDQRKRNHREQQCVFNQVLTLFAGRQVLEFHIQFEKRVVHPTSPL